MTVTHHSPLVYFILGLPRSGRGAIIQDLVEFEGGTDAGVYVAAHASDALSCGVDVYWEWRQDALHLPELPSTKPELLFWVSRPDQDPVDQLEAFKHWLAQAHVHLGRIFCILDCVRAYQSDRARKWYEGLIHFSDCVFLSRHQDVSGKWVSEFEKKRPPMPCLFVKPSAKGVLAHKVKVLEPFPLRLSHSFDAFDKPFWSLPEDEDDNDEEDVTPQPDPYFARKKTGQRRHPLPDVAALILDPPKPPRQPEPPIAP